MGISRALWLRSCCVVVGAAPLVAVVMPGGAPATVAGPSGAPPVPSLRWQACDSGYQCATAQVPLDYRHPHGQTIDIAVIRHLATDPAHRIGSLFFNPGGPGTPGTLGLPQLYGQFPAGVRARFDVISFDPRGVGQSTSLRCFPSVAAEQEFLSELPAGFPVGARQEAIWESTQAQFDARCARRDLSLLDHMSTADVARDMDLLRQAVRDPALNYLGISYGTILGATYANLFPARVGSMVLDGNVNPVTWSNGDGTLSTFLRSGADQAAAATLDAFLNLCGQAPAASCAFSAGRPAATRAKFSDLLQRLGQHPVTAGPPSQTYTYASTIETVVNSILYTTVAAGPLGAGWQAGARLLEQLWTASAPDAPAAAAAATAAAATAAAEQRRYLPPEQRIGVICADSPNPRDPADYAAGARVAYARSGAIGLDWAWGAENCASWPASAAQDRYTGPWNRPTGHPILVIGNTGDPATSYQSSVAMASDLGRARLLTVDGYGHTEFGNKSACADSYETSYLLTGALPPAGTVCRQNSQPFPTATGH